MKRRSVIVVAVAVAVLLGACSKKEEAEDPLASPYLKTMDKAEQAEKELEKRAEELEAQLEELDN